MTNRLIISVDVMGGDNAPRATMEGLAMAAKKHPEVFFLVFGNEEKLEPFIEEFKLDKTQFKVHHTTQIVKADEKPSHVIRYGQETSMYKAIMSVRNGYAKAIISAGNTGALMATSKICLGTLPGIDRPAIAAILPSLKGPIVALDLGANAECNSRNLVEFAIMGSVFHQVMFDDIMPSIGLLNIGSEENKGRDEIKEAAGILKNKSEKLNFKGFVEGNDIALGAAQVIVTDGFSGNVALKTLEGSIKMIGKTVKNLIKKSLLAKLGFLLALPAVFRLKKEMDPRRFNGAMFLGLNAISVKSHGGTDAFGFACAIESAINMVKNDMCTKIKNKLEEVMQEEEKN